MLIDKSLLDIEKIAESGQCFRLVGNGDGSYGLIYNGRFLKISPGEDGKTCELCCGADEYEDIWKDYFDMSFDYGAALSSVDEEDGFLSAAARYGAGIRILRQDPWETLVSFIISQRKSIPAIRTSVEKLCGLCGDAIHTEYGVKYSFPRAARVAALSTAELASCSLGYRAEYVARAAEAAASGRVSLSALSALDDEGLRRELMKFYGVGEKVADCVMLFAYHRLDAFPKDVWINRALAEKYPEGFPMERYAGYSGIMQQYIFYYMKNGYKDND